MPIFRSFWGWIAFALLAIAGLAVAVATTEWDGSWGFVIAVGHNVEPIWVSAAILVYTVTEGVAMIAESFLRKRFEQGKAEGEAKGIAAAAKAAERRGLTADEIERVVEEAREIIRNGRDRD